MKFSANLGFLWKDLELPEAILAAKAAGFSAVECHWPYDVPVEDVRAALDTTGFEMQSLNTLPGDVDAGEIGVAALVGREKQARSYIDQAIDYARQIGCRKIHVMAGKTDQDPKSQATYCANLTYAANLAARNDIMVLIEPLNHRDAPGYHLTSLDDALVTIQSVDRPNVKIMFDCYHVQILHGDLINRLKTFLPYVGHIQIAAVPDRGEPDSGEINYAWLLRAFEALGWKGYIGAEYRPRHGVEAGIGWLKTIRNKPTEVKSQVLKSDRPFP